MTAISLPSPLEERGEKLDAVIVCALLTVGMCVPTSFGNDRPFFGPAYLLCTFLFLCLILRRGRFPSPPLAICLLSIIPLLLLFTYTSGFSNATLGETAQFTTLALLYMSNLRRIHFSRWLFNVFLIVNMLNIGLGIAILAGNELVRGFLINYYAQFNEGLVPGMLLLRKPVLTFGTHSLAGFFLYVFFYINWQTYRTNRRKLFLAFAVCYLGLTLALLSVTGLLLGVVGIIQVLYSTWSSAKYRWVWASSTFVVGVLLLSFQWDVVWKYGSQIAEGANAILTSPGSGFLGRLTATGTMYGILQYLINHPFAPVGLSRNDELLIADMGLLDYLIRGSVFLVVWVYGGLFFFLRRNVLAKADRYFLFVAIVAFELGFSALLYFRMPFLLAFFVIYLNGLRRSQGCADGRDVRAGMNPGWPTQRYPKPVATQKALEVPTGH